MTRLVESVLQSRKNLCQLVIVAVLLALGVALFANWLSALFEQKSWVLWASSILLFAVAVGYLAFSLWRATSIEHEFEAALIFDSELGEHVRVDEYELSEKFDQALNALFVENAAFKATWQSEHGLGTNRKQEKDKSQERIGDNEAAKGKRDSNVTYWAIIQKKIQNVEELAYRKTLLIETAEFCLLEFLSLHLSSYFGSTHHDKSRIETLERKDIPNILLENRVLAMLTTPVEDRQVFIDSGFRDDPPDGEIHSILSSNGAVYERFNLILPRGTRVSRPVPGVIHLDHRHFTLTMGSRYMGFALNLPTYFEQLYLDRDLRSCSPKKLDVFLAARLKATAFGLVDGWEYYSWIDSFSDYLSNHVDFNAFLHRIDWLSVSTRIRAGLILQKRRQKKSKPDELVEGTERKSESMDPTAGLTDGSAEESG